MSEAARFKAVPGSSKAADNNRYIYKPWGLSIFMPKCPKCQKHYDDLFDVSECISSHKNDVRAAIVAPPRVINKRMIGDIPFYSSAPTSAKWTDLPTGLFTGNRDDMKLLDAYFELFAREFDAWLIFPEKWGKHIPLVRGVERPPDRCEPPTMMHDKELDHRIPITLMPNRKKKSTHGYFRYKTRRHIGTKVIWRGYDCEINIAPNLPIQSVICTLAHEMCHYAQYIEADRWIDRESLGGGWGKSHGPTFVRHLKMFNEVARAKGSELRVDKKCHSGRGHEAEVYDRIEWVRDNLRKGDIFYWEWKGSNDEPFVGVYSVRGRYAHRVKGYVITGTAVHDQCIPWSCIKFVWRDDFPREFTPDNDKFRELMEEIMILPNGPSSPQYGRWSND